MFVDTIRETFTQPIVWNLIEKNTFTVTQLLFVSACAWLFYLIREIRLIIPIKTSYYLYDHI